MSRQIALDNIALQPAERWAHTEYSLEYHHDLIAKVSGLDADDPAALRRARDKWLIDFNFGTNNGLIDWSTAGRTTDMGHAAYAIDGSDQRKPAESPFRSPEEVWAFDAVEEYGLPDFDAQVRAYEQYIEDRRRTYPNQLSAGGYYCTLVSGAIAAFGWDMLLMGASDPARMEKVFDSFFRRTLFFMKAWAQTSAEVIIQHDDFVWTSGAFMHPDIYRRVLVPRYAELWKPLHDAGKKVLFCSDGDYTEFAEDVADAGADGLIFEPFMDFGRMVDAFGKHCCLVGSFVDCRDMTFGRWDKVRADIDRTFERLNDCKGAIVAVGNHVPPNIPDDMMERYFAYLLPRLNRTP